MTTGDMSASDKDKVAHRVGSCKETDVVEALLEAGEEGETCPAASQRGQKRERDTEPQPPSDHKPGSEPGSGGNSSIQALEKAEGQVAGVNGKARNTGTAQGSDIKQEVKEFGCTVGERFGMRVGEEPGGSGPTVVVVGGGLAGLSAAVEVLRGGGSVVIVEKCPKLGGNSAKASSGINAAGSQPQKQQGVPDNPEDFRADTLRSGKGRSSEELVSVLVNGSASAIDFLESFGIDLSSITKLGGHSHPRTHRNKADGTAMNLGYRVMSTLIKYVEQQPAEHVRILTGMQASSLIRDDTPHGSRIVGVRLRAAEAKALQGASGEARGGLAEGGDAEVVVRGGSVILATGGYSADREGLLTQHVPKLRRLPTTNGPFALGEGVKIAVAAGASLIDMDQVQLHPTGFVDPKDPDSPTKFLAPEALRGCGGILVNHEGRRFVDELSTRDAVVSAMLASCRPEPDVNRAMPEDTRTDNNTHTASPVVAYMILNEYALQKFDPSIAAFYIKRGLIQKFQDVNELSKVYNLPSENVAATLAAQGTESESHDGPGAGRPSTPFRPDEVLYGAMVTPVLHYCMGGLRIDLRSHVLDEGGVAIGGLFAAGEVTGGVHGGNRLAGNSLLECVVFGRIAGKSALCEASSGTGVSSL